METTFIALSLFAGALLAVQAGANAQLSRAVGSPFGATALQLGVGALLLLAAAIAAGGLERLSGLHKVPAWHLAGGTASAFYVVATILLFPRLGAVVSVGLFIAGQMLASLALDHFAMLGVPAAPLDGPALAGALAVLAGAAAIAWGQDGRRETARGLSRLAWIALALAAGAVLPVQAAVNALLHADLGAPFPVGVVSFLVATASMALVLAIAMALFGAPKPRIAAVAAMPWWGWLGGLAGATYVMAMFTGMPAIGAASVVGLAIAGQQLASLLVDRYGWFRLPRRPTPPLRLAGVAALLVGVGLIKTL